MLSVIGWVGATCFAVCALPQTVRCVKQGHARGLDQLFLWLWLVGEICMLTYSLGRIGDPALITNYVFNLACLTIILRYRLFPRTGSRG